MYNIVFCMGTSIVMVLHVQFTDTLVLHINIFFKIYQIFVNVTFTEIFLKFLTVRKKFTHIITFREQHVVSVNSN